MLVGHALWAARVVQGSAHLDYPILGRALAKSLIRQRFNNWQSRTLFTYSFLHLTLYRMSEIGDSIQAKCLDFVDRIIKLNDTMLNVAANAKAFAA